MQLPGITIRGKFYETCIIQGGMGIGVSRATLSGTVANEGGIGVISSAGIDYLISCDLRKTVSTYEAMCIELYMTRILSRGHGGIGANIMCYLARNFEESVRGTIDGGADMIICGAGLPLSLPDIVGNADIALLPIVSSARALRLICARWEKKGRRPDAVVVEGPLAGGHLGFSYDDLQKPECQLEAIFQPIKDFAQSHGDFPVIVAGGVYSHEDIVLWLSRGADGVQMGTRFLATEESGASLLYKQAVVECTEHDIVVCHNSMCPPGSPSGMPFRTMMNTPMFAFGSLRKPLCNRGYVLQKDAHGKFTLCGAKTEPRKNFCICNGLFASAGYVRNEHPLYTVGTNAHRITQILTVTELINELKGLS